MQVSHLLAADLPLFVILADLDHEPLVLHARFVDRRPVRRRLFIYRFANPFHPWKPTLRGLLLRSKSP